MTVPDVDGAVKECEDSGWFNEIRTNAPFWLGRFETAERHQTMWRISRARQWESDVQRAAMVALWQLGDFERRPDLLPEVGYPHAALSIKKLADLLWFRLHEFSGFHQNGNRQAIRRLLLELAEEAGLMAAPGKRGAPRRQPTREDLSKLRVQAEWIVNNVVAWADLSEQFAHRYALSSEEGWYTRFPILAHEECEGLLDPTVYGHWSKRNYSRADWLMAQRLNLGAERLHRTVSPRRRSNT